MDDLNLYFLLNILFYFKTCQKNLDNTTLGDEIIHCIRSLLRQLVTLSITMKK